MDIRRRSNVSGFSERSSVPGVGHGKDEDTLALMARADFRRREQSAFNRETKSSKVSPYALEATRGEHAADVLDEDEPRTGLDDDAPCVGPQVALVFFGAALAREAVRLARDAANDAIHEATPWAAVEGSDIRPHRRRSQETLLHRLDQVSDGEGFPLHAQDCASMRDCQLDSEIESAAACA
jgi:hypothetical protein